MIRQLIRSIVLMSVFPGIACAAVSPPAKRDYIVTTAKPGRLFVIDAAARKVVSDFQIPDANGWTGTLAVPDDGRVAYVLVNRMESVAGIDLVTGQQVFRADLSSGNERVKSIYAINVTPDGKRLIVYELPTTIGPNEYQVQPTRFSVFDTASGLEAKPIARFPAPRRIHLILPRPGNKRFFAIGAELYEFDLESGALIEQRGIRNWAREGYSSPDFIHFWPATEPTGVFTAALVARRGDGAAAVDRSVLMMLDLESGALDYKDFEDTSAMIFTTVMSPRKGEAFSVFAQMGKIDVENGRLVKRVDMPHSFYTIGIASDGSEVFTGGTSCHIGFFDPDTLAQRALLKLPGCPDQSNAGMRVIRR